MVCWDLRLCLRWGESCLGRGFGRGKVEDVSENRALRRWEKGRPAAMVAN